LLTPQTCPILSREHKRTSEKNVSATYVVLNAFECTVRCFDESCTDVITLRKPKDDLMAELQSYTKDFRLKRSLYKQTHETVANYVFDMVKELHAASPTPSGASYIWYYYDEREHRWIQQENIMLAIMSENGVVQRSYNDYISRVNTDQVMSENDKKIIKELWSGSKDYPGLEKQLQTTGFVRGGILPILARKLEGHWMNIIRKLPRKARGTNFQSVLDDNPELLGCTNGVWDLHKRVFRKGSPRDFISMSTNLKYTPYSQMPQNLKDEMFSFLKKIYANKAHLDYIMCEIASCLNGTPEQQRLFLMTGRGANGKSTLIRLLNISFGDYAGEVNITVFTKPRPSANAPAPELHAIKGQRFVSCSEPNAKDPLNLGTIKWYTGGDRITAAQKYEKNQSFYLQCTFFLLTNDIPPINASVGDYGTWRRLKPVEHYSRFVEKPDPNNPLEFQTDDNVNHKMDAWKELFLSYVLEIYLSKKVCKVPPEFTQSLHKLQDNNDVYSRFVQEFVIRNDEEFKEALAVFEAFNGWNKLKKIIRREVSYDNFEKHMLTLIGPFVTDEDGRQGWNVELKRLPNAFF